MSKLDDLIRELCPNGVYYRPLWLLTIWDKKFNSVGKDKQTETRKYTYLLADKLKKLSVDNGNVKILTTSITDLWANEDDVDDFIVDDEIVCIPWGGNPVVQYYKGKFITGDNRIAIVRNKNELNTKFLYYYLINKLDLISTFYRGSGIKHPDMSKVLELNIPLPPLPVQEEIVRILDNFTELTNELTDKLTAELTARKKVYTYYQEKLLSFDSEIEIKKLSEIANVYDSLHQTPKYSQNGYPMIRVQDIKKGYINLDTTLKVEEKIFQKFTQKYCPQRDDIVVSRVGSYGNFALIPNNKCCLGQNVAVISSKIEPRYLYYVLISNQTKKWIEKNVKGANQKSFSLENIKRIPIPYPTRKEQQRIVDILDRFDKLCNDISEGLPAEIEARQKQYEYYRDKLLTFKPLEEVK